MCGLTYVTVCMWISDESWRELVLLLYYISPYSDAQATSWVGGAFIYRGTPQPHCSNSFHNTISDPVPSKTFSKSAFCQIKLTFESTYFE